MPVAYYDLPNFGDQLTPLVFRHFGLSAFHCPSFRFSQAAGVGSILQMLPSGYSGYILGSGLISEKRRYFPDARPLLVRGKLTRDMAAFPNDTLLGDPGLVIDSIFPVGDGIQNKFDLGIIPHYSDSAHDWLGFSLSNTNTMSVKVIDVRRPVGEVVNDIVRCKKVFSSSLHGLIVADSFGIPNLWLKFSDRIIGGDFKYHDYYSSFGVERRPFVVDSLIRPAEILNQCRVLPREGVAAIKADIHSVYHDFAALIENRCKQYD